MQIMKIHILGVALTIALLTGCDAQQNECGLAPLNTRIVGGQNAPVGSWPWQVSLQRNNNHFCGGSLINNQWILTAAHCFDSTSTAGLLVYLGLQKLATMDSFSMSSGVSNIIKHPNYNSKSEDNDITLLQLVSPVSFTNYIRPVCLAASDSTFFNGTLIWVTGWGNTASGVSLPSPGNLQEVQVPIVGNRKCKCLYGVSSITDNMVCAGLLQGGKDSCQGDSGGPMVSKQGSVWIQSGVVSFGTGCAQPNFPGVYTRVSKYQSWIQQTITTNQPGFVMYNSTGTDGDLSVNCNGLPTIAPTTASTTLKTTTTMPTTTVAPVVCGSAKLNSGAGGNSSLASPGMWPWIASVQFNGSHVCGGALIAEQFVMTSAGCFPNSTNATGWTVVLGRLNQNSFNPNEVSIKVANFSMSNSSGNNVAVLQLAVTPNFTNYIQPICVDLGGNNVDGNSQCWAAGWGSGAGGVNQTLQQYQTSIVSCGNSSSSNTSICTSAFDLQQGVQGGPLMCLVGQSWVHIAVLTISNSNSNSNSSISNSTLNNSTLNNSTINNSTVNNSTVNNSTSSKSADSSPTLRAQGVQVFTKTSSFSTFLTAVISSFPQKASNTTNAITSAPSASTSNSNQTTSSGSPASFSSCYTVSIFLSSLLTLQIFHKSIF